MKAIIGVVLSALFSLLHFASAMAQDGFYKGKTVRIIVTALPRAVATTRTHARSLDTWASTSPETRS